jgi:hypothetical protein
MQVIPETRIMRQEQSHYITRLWLDEYKERSSRSIGQHLKSASYIFLLLHLLTILTRQYVLASPPRLSLLRACLRSPNAAKARRGIHNPLPRQELRRSRIHHPLRRRRPNLYALSTHTVLSHPSNRAQASLLPSLPPSISRPARCA